MDEIVSGQRDRVQRSRKRRRAVGAKEREQIVVASVEGRSQPEIAAAFGRSLHTVRGLLRSEAGKRRTAELLREIADASRSKLRRAAGRAAESWLKQLELVDDGQRGNHLPDRDLLTHTGVLDVAAPKKDAADHIVIQIGGVSADDFVPVEAPEAAPSATPRQITIGTGDDDVLPVEEP